MDKRERDERDSGRRATAPPSPTRNKSWVPGQKGQGGEGMSKGYGGSAGPGTGPSGPDTDQPRPDGTSPRQQKTSTPRKATKAKHKTTHTPRPEESASSCLPSRERIEKVLR